MALTQVNSLEFNEIKAQLKSYLRSQSEFSDYDFEGSSLSILLDVLAYNSYYSSVNANLLVNENFLDTAVLRENVVKLSKLIGYTPRSARSARANFTVVVQTVYGSGANGRGYPESVQINKGVFASFTGENNSNYIFSIPKDLIVSVNTLDGKATFTGVVSYEGVFITDTFVKSTSDRQRFILANNGADTSSMTVEVTRGTLTDAYLEATDITALDGTSKIFFLEESETKRSELIFGDGILGDELLNGDVIEATYTTSSGAAPNGLTGFSFAGTVKNSQNDPITSGITLTLDSAPDGGADAEGIDSIKYSAPKFYSSFGRAVTTKDYEAIIPQIYPNVQSIVAFGGEEADPPEYGKVMVVIKPKNADKLSISEKDAVQKKIRSYSVGAVEPKIMDPSVLYIDLTSFVYFNPNASRRSQDDIKQIIYRTLENLNSSAEFNKFGGKFKYSKVQKIIDDAEPAITSNITRVRMRKNVIVTLNQRFNYKICFGNRINAQLETPTFETNGFKRADGGNQIYYLNDDGLGTVRLFYVNADGSKQYIGGNWGTVDYANGKVTINDLIIDEVVNSTDNLIQFSVVPESNDLVSLRETYLTLGIDNLVVNVIDDEISSGSNTSGTGIIPESSYS
tara:strand:- start:18914 stop:20788 length:1875 start_codon:yes stop_codon:yes gene_type:complete